MEASSQTPCPWTLSLDPHHIATNTCYSSHTNGAWISLQHKSLGETIKQEREYGGLKNLNPPLASVATVRFAQSR